MEEKAVEKVQDEMRREDIPTLVVSKQSNIEYLTGITELSGVVVLHQDSFDILASKFSRYSTRELSNIEVYTGGDEKEELLKEAGLGQDGFADAPGRFENFDLNGSEVLEEARKYKEGYEVKRIRRGCEILSKSFRNLLSNFSPGMSEWEAVNQVDKTFREEGVYHAFNPLVHSNVKEPHRHPSHEEIEKGDLFLVDQGCRVDNYCSDMTRMVPNHVEGERKDLIDTVSRIQKKLIAYVEPGIEASELAEYARSMVEEQGFSVEKHFLHGVGHGVGIDIHEYPSIEAESDDLLEEGMVFTIEPGLYVPGVGGVRIEDSLVMKKEEAVRLTGEKRIYER
ncbi:MAG: Xaa-Pro peptidase family protein [Candidatus Nanohaloarchaeota archaeon QJJ-9]|nr:Xaa-Pro peptidase family protein [Candidatus Nanohaloarchaeota archaeon QJJ-9]